MRTMPRELPAITFSALSSAESNSSEIGSAFMTVSNDPLAGWNVQLGGLKLVAAHGDAGVEDFLGQRRRMAGHNDEQSRED